MKIEKIEKLRKIWGEKPCGHSLLKKSDANNDKVCATCGRTVIREISFKSKDMFQGIFNSN